MRKQLFKRVMSVLLVVCMVLAYVPAVNATGVTWKETDQTITAERTDRLVQKDGTADRDPSEMVRVSIVLEKPSTVGAGYATMGISTNRAAMSYRAELQAAQKRMERTISQKALNGRPLDVVWNMTLVGNIISAWVPYGSLETIAAIDGIKTVAMEAQYEPCVVERIEGVSPNAYPSSGMIGSGNLWNGGYTGAGSRIAIVDTGTDTDHQSFDNGAYLHALAENAEAKGMSLETYMASLDLLTQEEIAAALPKMNLSSMNPNVTAEELYLNEKLAFGYNYVDNNKIIDHDDDMQGEHGSHVAGIATANRFIPQNGSYVDARDSVMMQGVAPDAQLITMKVFGGRSPYDSDYMAAIEDAILLNCDAVNLSLGTTVPGSPYTDVYSDLMEMMTETDTVVVISAGNAYNWAVASTFGYLYNDDVSFDTVGAPGSYGSAFTVASVDNDGVMSNYFTVNGKNYLYAEPTGFGNTPLQKLDVSSDQSGTPYEYVFLDGLGYPEEYDGIDVNGKVVFVSRGTLNFAEKANNALSRGASAVAIYNNESGMHSMDLTGLNYACPVFGITQKDAAAIREASQNKGTYLTGRITICGKQDILMSNAEYYTMSDFSSWGVPGSLTMKPEITAPGGQIYSIWGSNAVTGGGSDQYETMSGTSMAAPQVTGMAALLAQYFRESGKDDASGLSARHLAQSLLMSTAQPLYEEASGGNYYSLLNQGSGLARVDLAAAADSFIKVEGQDDYKVKAELGDDPSRTGIYEFDFTITNMTDSAKAYTLDADLFRQDVFEYQQGSDVWLLDTWTTALDGEVDFYSDAMSGGSGLNRDLNGDGITSAADADYLLEYVVGNVAKLEADGDLSGDGQINSYDAHLLLASLNGEVLTVPAKGTVNVHVCMTLTDEAKATLNTETPKGTYVEAFVYARGVADAEGKAGTVHSIPVLAFYGDWSEPSMFDRGTLMELVYMTTNTAPYLYRVIGNYGNALGIDYGDGKEYYYGGNPILDDDTYIPERNAFNSQDASCITEQSFTLIRGAGAARIQITNADSGEVYFERELGELYPTYYSPSYGDWDYTIQYARLNWTGTDAAGKSLAEGTEVNISMTAVPHYYRQADGSFSYEDLGSGSTMTTSFTIDNTMPEVLDIDASRVNDGILKVKARDNRHVAAIALLNANGSKMMAVESPNQTVKNQTVTVELDISKVTGQKFLVAVYDYASNMQAYEVTLDLPEIERSYFTAINCNTNTYVGMDMSAGMTDISTLDIPTAARAAEFAEGYVFVITEDNMLCVANDKDLSATNLIGKLDASNERLIDTFADMAYNRADSKMYALFYSASNDNEKPFLCTIDLDDGSLDVLCEMPVDVHTLAIDDNGTCWSAGYNSAFLYKYTVEEAVAGQVSYVGEMGYYATEAACSMAWDHKEDKLYFCYPNTLLRISTQNAEPTLLGYFNDQCVGLYIAETVANSAFAPTQRVDGVTLNTDETRIMLGNSLPLEASVWPWYANNRAVTWTTSDASVATVDAGGNVTAKAQGECVITATSVLDPTKSASCTVSTFALEKTLNAVIWDDEGYVWMSEFTTDDLPNYTKLTDAPMDLAMASATVGQDGKLYAASLDMTDLQSELYTLDPVTFEPTLIGASTDGYVDLAPAPGQPGNSLMAVYGGNVMNVDADTGDYYNWYPMFQNNLVALAYVGTMPYQEPGWDTEIDWYFIIDELGYVYLLGFMEQSGNYYYMEHDQLAPDGIYTKLDFEMETPYYASAYFDGEMLYYSAYQESQDNVTLMAIDVTGGSKACYELGTFEDSIWPVAGLMELDGFENHMDVLANTERIQTMSQPIPVEQQPELKGIREEKADGTLNNTVAPMSSSDVKDDLVYIYVTLPYAGTNADMTVSFDTGMLELVSVDGNTTAFAWSGSSGKTRLSLAEANTISNATTVARLTFRRVGQDETTVSIVTGGLGDEGCGYDERITVPAKAHVHSYTSVVTKPTCTEKGYTTYTCNCGHSYIGNEVPALGHREVIDPGYAATCTKTGLTEGKHCSVCNTVLVAQQVIAAKGHHYSNGYCDACGTKDPNYVEHTHSYGDWVVVKAPSSQQEGLEKRTCSCGSAETRTIPRLTNPFSDVKTGDYYYEPVLWASWQGITTGINAREFGPARPCTRGQIVTFLWRAAGEPEPTSTYNPFQDVFRSDYYYKAVLWAVEKGITNGMSATRFAPNSTCTRAQSVTFLYRANNKPKVSGSANPFRDVKSSAYYYDAVLWAVENGITNGMSATEFRPDLNCTRAQIVTFLYRSFVD